MSEHAVIVKFSYGSTNLDALFTLEEQLEKTLNAKQVGEYDGNEMAVDGSDGTLYMYGPDADKLFVVIKPMLENATYMQGANVLLRYGLPEDGVREVEVHIGD